LQDRFPECELLLGQIESTITDDKDRTFYAHRYAELTRTRLLMRMDRAAEALLNCERVLQLAQATGDGILRRLTLILKSQLLYAAGQVTECSSTLVEALDYTSLLSIEIFSGYESVMTNVLAKRGEIQLADSHRRRGQRICEISANVPTTVEYNRSIASSFIALESGISRVADRKTGAR